MFETTEFLAKAVQATQRRFGGLDIVMELKPGYKQTEAGVIPEEWEVGSMASIAAAAIQNGLFNEPSRKGRGCKLINVINLYSAVPIETAGLEQFDATRDEISRFGISHGDLFFTRSSLTVDGIAYCNVYQKKLDETIVFDCHIIRAQPNQRKVEPLFLGYSVSFVVPQSDRAG